MVVLSLLILTLFISLFVAVGHKLAWLDYLYVASYVKLAITLIKYIPQVILVCLQNLAIAHSNMVTLKFQNTVEPLNIGHTWDSAFCPL